MVANLPAVRTHERIDYKRCVKKWYWRWRMGLIPKAVSFGALELGTWMHLALERWYGQGFKRNGLLVNHFLDVCETALGEAEAAGAPAHQMEKAEELWALGQAMASAYQAHYGRDENVNVIAAEIPLEFAIDDAEGNPLGVHRLKPDMVYLDPYDDAWLMENKTATTIRTDHLVIDDQARPYGAMAERALRKLGLITKRQRFRGITYNYLRKGLPDTRPTDESGRYLNKNGSVSKKQTAPLFVRKNITMTRAAKVITLNRIAMEVHLLVTMGNALRNKQLDPKHLPKTPHISCPRTCQFFAMCTAEEEGVDIREMQRLMYVRRDPYAYEKESTDEIVSFEMG